MPKGKIIKGIAGFYYVHDGQRVWACRAAGIFRKFKFKPLVGDDAEFEITHEADGEGNVIRILPRKNRLIRPEVANIDQALILFAVSSPDPNFGVLDRFLIMMGQMDIPCVIAFNKTDLKDEQKRIEEIYRPAGYELLFLSVQEDEGVSAVRNLLTGKTTVLAGPSGVGKSSLMNRLLPTAGAVTGEVSAKIGRGKQTTRHSEIFCIGPDTYVLDTPGFTSLEIAGPDEYNLRDYFPEFAQYTKDCRFPDCVHIGERECGVKAAVSGGLISPVRYQSYTEIYAEIKNNKKY